MKNKFLWTAILCLALSGVVHAKEPPNMEKMQEDVRKIQQQAEKQRQQDLERLKELDPKSYESQRKSQERQAQILKILFSYQKKAITADDAERKLTPLVQQEVQQELAGIDNQIKTLGKKLAALQQAKSNPNTLVKKRVDQMLGRGGPPSPDELF